MNPFNFHQSRPGEKQLGDILKKKKDSEGDYVLFQDGDLEYNPDDYIKIFNVINSSINTCT